jgi:hypothetical protein|tara:strand:+ start:3979 stop:4965 length:987 start_codon:yes stop_codon:yes gene_type:complete
MIENNKNPEVELDIDDAKETNIQLEEKKEEKSKLPSLNVGEVDLGYANHDEQREKPEISIQEDVVDKQESKPKDDLNSFSDGVQKRIDKLTKRMREAERREQAALEYAEGLKNKYTKTKAQYDEIDEGYVRQYDARIDAEKDSVKKRLKDAIEMQDTDAIINANEELARLTVEKERAKITIADREKRKKEAPVEEVEAQAPQQNRRVSQPIPSPKAKDWAENNEWFGQDQYMTNTAFQIHENLVGEGLDVDSDEYYNEIDKQMKEVFPHKFVNQEEPQEQRKPVQAVASANRGKTGRRIVKLTKSQVAIAKKLGVPLEEYAKYVKEAN